MKFKIIVGIFLTSFLVFCGLLIAETGIFSAEPDTGIVALASISDSSSKTSNSRADTNSLDVKYDITKLMVLPAENKVVSLGSKERGSDFLFQVDLDSKGAAISSAYLNRYDNLDKKNPQSYYQLLAPVKTDSGREVLSFANDAFILVDQKLKLRLNNLNWHFKGKTVLPGVSEEAVFTTEIFDLHSNKVIELKKTYTVKSGLHHLFCKLEVKNASTIDLTAAVDIHSPIGIVREGARSDLRKIITGYENTDGQIETVKLTNTNARKAFVGRLEGKLDKAEFNEKIRISSEHITSKLLWTAIVNKYFAAITRPVPVDSQDSSDGISVSTARYYEMGLKSDPQKRVDPAACLGFKFHINKFKLAPGKSNTFEFQLYLGSKDKDLFQEDPLYSSLHFINSIDFQSCCSFGWVTSLSFVILGLMKWAYTFIPNYGIIIILLVLFVRLLLHPITKKSQISMMSMQKLGPKAEELRKKYQNNKTELNKQMMKLYREQGASPVLGCLPMVLQMPIWIALYSAIYASVELRGAAFLPFWITDLSAPDALFSFSPITIPLINTQLDSFNLLPILLGVSFALQQKLMPHAATTADPKMAQQQKMMQWMMPAMMLVFLYKAPSGLNLYIMASTFGGIFEQYIIRKHIKEKQQQQEMGRIPVTKKTGGKVKKKKPKPMFKNTM